VSIDWQVQGGEAPLLKLQDSHQDLTIDSPEVRLRAALAVPKDARSIVLFAHGAGGTRHSSRNRYIAQKLHEAGFATLLVDLLTEDEERIDAYTARLRFDVPLLAGRLESATGWILLQPRMKDFDVGYFGVDTGAAASLIAAIQRPEAVRAIVARSGRPDLAFSVLPEVRPPVQFIVGSKDQLVLEINRRAAKRLTTEHHLAVIPGASHLFEEPGKLDIAARYAQRWFSRYMKTPAALAPENRFDYSGVSSGLSQRI
jgi:putative phosphoribosyl transferase